jgi:hypothetical protein
VEGDKEARAGGNKIGMQTEDSNDKSNELDAGIMLGSFWGWLCKPYRILGVASRPSYVDVFSQGYQVTHKHLSSHPFWEGPRL